MGSMFHRVEKRIAEAHEMFDAGFKSEAGRKRALEALSRAYDEIREFTMHAMLAARTPETYEAITEDYYSIPFGLHQVRDAHFETAAKYTTEFQTVEELVLLRNAIKSVAITPVVKVAKTSPRMEAMKKSFLEMMEAKKKNFDAAVSSANYTVANEHVPHVSIHGHWVCGHKGTNFVRYFWYLNGTVTAENTIAAVFQKLEDEGKIEPFLNEEGETCMRVVKGS
jgi:hypothetical protein